MLIFKKIQLACELGLPIGIPLLNCSRIAQNCAEFIRDRNYMHASKVNLLKRWKST